MSHKDKDHPHATAPAEGAADCQPEPTPAPAPAPEGADDARKPLFWRTFGAALALVAAVIGVLVYQHLAGQVQGLRTELSSLSGDLRKDLGRLGESHGAMIKKDDHSTRLRTVWDTIKELRADRSDLSMLKERSTVLFELVKANEEERRQMIAEVRKLRETRSGQDEREGLVREIRALRERIAQLEAGKRPLVVPAGHGGQ